MLSPAFVEIREALAQVPFVSHIETQNDYERALELIYRSWVQKAM